MGTNLYENEKYFLFKIKDVLNNGYHSFEAKRMESISLCLRLCVDTAKEIEVSHNAELLINAYKSLLRSLKLLLEYHPFQRLEKFKDDNSNIIKKIDKYSNNSNDRKIADELFKAICSVYKRLEMEPCTKYYVKIILNGADLSYQEIDDVIGFMISDLLYQGYSMQFLREWYGNNIMTSDFFGVQEQGERLDAFIEKFSELTGSKKKYKVYIKYSGGGVLQRERADKIISHKFFPVVSEHMDNDWFYDERYSSVVVGEYWTCDFYKAVRVAQKQFPQLKELYHMSEGAAVEKPIIREQVLYGVDVEGSFKITNIRKNADVELIGFIDRAKKQQYDAFIEILSEKENEDFDTLDRVLHTLYNAKAYNVQNRFLNFWSSMEYLLYPFPKKSIIEFYEKCKGEADDYRTVEVIDFLMNKDKSYRFVEEQKNHCVIVREFKELYMLINDGEKRKKAITDFTEIISSDIDIIYRMRNQLIHSGGQLDDSYEYVGLRLYKYVNAILSTILYYKQKNRNITISEILFSIHETYENYISNLEESVDKPRNMYKLVRPKYMYIE